jgi:hypothetical protein
VEGVEAFEISKTRVNNIKNWRIECLDPIEHENDKLCRKVRKRSEDITKATLNRFHKMRALNACILCRMIQEAALQLAKEFQVQYFQVLSRWLDSFKKRNLIP